jgi:hypothetical protein
MFGKQNLAVTVTPQDIGDFLAQSVYLGLALVAYKVREGYVKCLMAEHLQVLPCPKAGVYFYQRIVGVLVGLAPRPLVA